jgi:hypothetical protein
MFGMQRWVEGKVRMEAMSTSTTPTRLLVLVSNPAPAMGSFLAVVVRLRSHRSEWIGRAGVAA